MTFARNIPEWLNENHQYFLPPVCNKMYHGDGQMKAFFVGGPNQRKDYHIEEGEELFFQWKGDMILKIVELGKHRDVTIKEGEIFMLPGRIPHSPQRTEGTIGLVLERERPGDELDGLRYYVEGTTESLYEKWFHCDDLGKDLPPVIKEYFASQQYRTQTPIPGTIPDPSPVAIDVTTKVQDPFSVHQWLEDSAEELAKKRHKDMFTVGNGRQFQVTVYTGKCNVDPIAVAETFVWQLRGSCEITVKGESTKLDTNWSSLVPHNVGFDIDNAEGGACLVAYQDPTKKQKFA